jgi:hypothetical protein
VKHSIPRALVTKTRGAYTVAPEDWNGTSVVLAKAGYMTPEEDQTLTEIEQSRAWIARYRQRHFETKMTSKSLTSLRQQHLFEVDLQSVKRDVRWNADYDMKRKLVKVRNVPPTRCRGAPSTSSSRRETCWKTGSGLRGGF